MTDYGYTVTGTLVHGGRVDNQECHHAEVYLHGYDYITLPTGEKSFSFIWAVIGYNSCLTLPWIPTEGIGEFARDSALNRLNRHTFIGTPPAKYWRMTDLQVQPIMERTLFVEAIQILCPRVYAINAVADAIQTAIPEYVPWIIEKARVRVLTLQEAEGTEGQQDLTVC